MINKEKLLDTLQSIGYKIKKSYPEKYEFEDDTMLLFDGEFCTLRLWRNDSYISFYFTEISIGYGNYATFRLNGILTGCAKL